MLVCLAWLVVSPLRSAPSALHVYNISLIISILRAPALLFLCDVWVSLKKRRSNFNLNK